MALAEIKKILLNMDLNAIVFSCIILIFFIIGIYFGYNLAGDLWK